MVDKMAAGDFGSALICRSPHSSSNVGYYFPVLFCLNLDFNTRNGVLSNQACKNHAVFTPTIKRTSRKHTPPSSTPNLVK